MNNPHNYPTWKQIKDWLESQGVKEDDPIYILEIYEAINTFPHMFTAKRTDTGWDIS